MSNEFQVGTVEIDPVILGITSAEALTEELFQPRLVEYVAQKYKEVGRGAIKIYIDPDAELSEPMEGGE